MSNDHERFREMVETSQDWFWEFDENANFTYASPSIKKILGYEPEELIGLNAFDLMASAEAERVRYHFDPIAKKYLPFKNLENINIHKDGREVFIESSGTPIFDKEGQFRGYRGVDRDITERKQAEVALRKSEESYRLLVENQNELVVKVDADGRFLFVSPTYCRTFGKSEEELLGQSFMPLVHEEDRAATEKAMEDLLHPPHTAYVEQRAMTVSGWRWLAWSDRAMLDGKGRIEAIVGVARDITLRRQVKEELRDSREKLQNIFDNSSEWIWEMDLSGRHTYSNYRLSELLGYPPEEFVGKEFLGYLHQDDLLEVKETLPVLISEEQGWSDWVLRWRHKDGSYRYLESNAKPIFNAAGELVGYCGADRDITERKASEVALQAATQAAEAANRAKSLFLAKVSHEIRTPLTAIVGYGELMEDAELTSEHKKYLAAINAASDTLSLLINDILDLSKIDAGELVIKQEDIHLPSFITKIADVQQQQVAQKDLSFDVSIDADVPDLLVGDPLRIQQILLNLLGNAIKFTEKGAVSIDVSVVEEGGIRVLLDISVKDTGIGVAAGLHERIFDPFVQVFDSSSHQYSGSGLGLSISRSLADLMGGTVELESQEGVGSTFHLLIPLQKKTGDVSKAFLPEEEPLSWSGPALNILLAEDNTINIQFIKAVLENLGHKVMAAENGKIALEKLNTNVFDLVLMDIQMPVINGIDALKALRELEPLSGNRLTVIALTAYALIGDREKYLKMGFDGYLRKPFTTKELVNELVRVVPV